VGIWEADGKVRKASVEGRGARVGVVVVVSEDGDFGRFEGRGWKEGCDIGQGVGEGRFYEWIARDGLAGAAGG